MEKARAEAFYPQDVGEKTATHCAETVKAAGSGLWGGRFLGEGKVAFRDRGRVGNIHGWNPGSRIEKPARFIGSRIGDSPAVSESMFSSCGHV
jgi:hypothetical protein